MQTPRPLLVALVLALAPLPVSGEGVPLKEAEVRRVLEGIKISLARLETLQGLSSFSTPTGGHAPVQQIRFAFKKPFNLRIEELSRSFVFAHDGRWVTLLYPREADALHFDLEDGRAQVVRQFVSLLEIENFTPGFGLEEIRKHFALALYRDRNGYDAELTPYANGVWRMALGLHHIRISLDPTSYMPRKLLVYQRQTPARPPHLAFEMELKELSCNTPVRKELFTLKIPEAANVLDASDLGSMLLSSYMKRLQGTVEVVGEEIGNRLEQFLDSPWKR